MKKAIWMVFIFFILLLSAIYIFGFNLKIFILYILFSIICSECIIRYRNYKMKNKLIKDVYNVRDIYIASHPNLPYIYKANTEIQNNEKPLFPICKFSYEYPKQEIDHNGILKSPELSKEKNSNKENFKILFLGDSVIGSFLKNENKVYHVPDLVQSGLNQIGINATVQNCSTGGYTIQDILVKFMLKDLYEEPSVLVINCGYASIRSFLYKKYTPDNGHFRDNVDKFCFLMKLRNMLPDLGLYTLKYFYQLFLPSNARDDLLKYTSKEGFDINNDESAGLHFFFQHYQNLLLLAKSKNIHVITTTIPYYLYKETLGHKKFLKIVTLLNEGIKNISSEHNIDCLDLNSIIEKSDTFFVDEAHLGHKGMTIAAEEIANLIAKKMSL